MFGGHSEARIEAVRWKQAINFSKGAPRDEGQRTAVCGTDVAQESGQRNGDAHTGRGGREIKQGAVNIEKNGFIAVQFGRPTLVSHQDLCRQSVAQNQPLAVGFRL